MSSSSSVNGAKKERKARLAEAARARLQSGERFELHELITAFGLSFKEGKKVFLQTLEEMSAETRRADAKSSRGEKSVKENVALRKGKNGQINHDIRHHLRGLLRQIVSYLWHKAKDDPDHFAWPAPKTVMKKCRRWDGKHEGEPYGHAAFYDYLRAAERMGMALPATLWRGGKMRKGWIVPDHSAPDGTAECRLDLDIHLLEAQRLLAEASQRPSGKRLLRSGKMETPSGISETQSGKKQAQSGTISEPSGTNGSSERTPERKNSDANSNNAEVLDEEPRGFHVVMQDELCGNGGSKPCSALFNSGPLIQSCESGPAEKQTQKQNQPPLTASQFDAELNKAERPTGKGMAEKTIGETIDHHAFGLEDLVALVSDDEFDFAFLKSWPDRDWRPQGWKPAYATRDANEEELADIQKQAHGWLYDACRDALEALSGSPFRGRGSCADLMDAAMKILIAEHALKAPGGWLPTIRKLRATANQPMNAQEDSREDEPTSLAEALDEQESREPAGRPAPGSVTPDWEWAYIGKKSDLEMYRDLGRITDSEYQRRLAELENWRKAQQPATAVSAASAV